MYHRKEKNLFFYKFMRLQLNCLEVHLCRTCCLQSWAEVCDCKSHLQVLQGAWRGCWASPQCPCAPTRVVGLVGGSGAVGEQLGQEPAVGTNVQLLLAGSLRSQGMRAGASGK